MSALLNRGKQRTNEPCPDSRGGPKAHIWKKNNDPAPGTYEEIEAFDKNQHFIKKYRFRQEKKTSFFEALSKRKAKVPGVGHYIKKESAMDNCVSSPPRSLVRKR